MVATAIPAGFTAGLFGIGGGLITVPILLIQLTRLPKKFDNKDDISYKLFAATDLKVYTVVIATGVETLQTSGGSGTYDYNINSIS